MPSENEREAFLDSTVLIDLVFRHQKARAFAEAALCETPSRSSSKYVLFEIARGYIRYLFTLYNKSLEVDAYSELMEYAHSGQRIFKRYERGAMLGTLVDHQAWLEETADLRSPREALVIFRAWLRSHLLDSWTELSKERKASLVNRVGCRDALPGPAPRPDDRYDQDLLLDNCGHPDHCKLKDYLLKNREDFELLQRVLLKQELQDVETKHPAAALMRLLAWIGGAAFKRHDCHACGDALICHEAPPQSTVVSKNEKHFRPLCTALGKSLKSYR